jgi:hypothetical protein
MIGFIGISLQLESIITAHKQLMSKTYSAATNEESLLAESLNSRPEYSAPT